MNDTIWNTNWADNLLWELDPATGNIWGQFNAPGAGATGLAWDWHDNCLWHSDQGTDLIYKIDPATGTVITSFNSPDLIPQDLAFDGTYLWLNDFGGGEKNNTIYKIRIQ